MDSIIRKIDILLYNKSRPFVVMTCTFLILFVCAIDYITGSEMSFSIFYLIPILIVTWYSGKRTGVFMSLAGASLWISADIMAGHIYSHPVIPFWNAAVRLGFFLMGTFMLSMLRGAYEHEKKMAKVDYLTGVENSRAFNKAVEGEIERLKRYGEPFTLAYIDIDNFKAVNDRFGHMVGDSLLSSVANNIKEGVRTVDIVGRLGGDEFAILMPETQESGETAILGRLNSRLMKAVDEGGWPVSFSIGAITFKTPPVSASEAIKKADAAMYEVKTGGKAAIRHKIHDDGIKREAIH